MLFQILGGYVTCAVSDSWWLCNLCCFRCLGTVYACIVSGFLWLCAHVVLFQILDDYVQMGLFPKCLLSEGMHYSPPDDDDDDHDEDQWQWHHTRTCSWMIAMMLISDGGIITVSSFSFPAFIAMMMIGGINVITVSSFSFPANGHDNDLLSLFSSFSFPAYSLDDWWHQLHHNLFILIPSL